MTEQFRRFSNYGILTLYFTALLIPGIWLIAVDWSVESFVKLAFSVIFLSAWHLSFKNISRAVNYSIVFFALLSLDIFFFDIYSEPPTTPVLLAMSESNVGEAIDFMRGRELMLAMIILSCMTLWIVATRAARSVNLRIFDAKYLSIRLIAKFTIGNLIAMGCFFVTMPLIDRLVITYHINESASSQLKKIDEKSSTYFVRLKGTFPVGRLVSVAEYFREEMNFSNSNIKKSHFQFHARQSDEPLARQIHVLVIGETARGDHSQLNGYNRETNPILSKYEDVIPLRDIVSPWTFTNRSVPVMITRIPGNTSNRTIDEKSIISAFREAGFHTYWISNQQPIGLGETSITHFAREAHESIFLNASAKVMMVGGNYDEQVLGPLTKIIGKNERKQFIVIHMLGSHDSYDKRHPIEFDVFKPSLTSLQNANHHDVQNRIEVVNSFDNSMRYTDFVLSKIIGIVDATDSISSVLYSSDHGETLFDGSCTRSGHGSSGKQEFPVSALAWVSRGHRSYWPHKHEMLVRNAPKKITTEYIFPTVIDLAGISTTPSDSERSLSSGEFRLRRRLVNAPEPVDWDDSSTKGPCNLLVAHPDRAPRASL